MAGVTDGRIRQSSRYRHGFVELGKGAEDLPNEPRRRRILDEGLRTVGRDQLDAALGEHGVAHLLDHEVAGETAGRLHDDRADAVPLNPLEHRRVGSTPSEPKLIDINTASADDLNRLGERFGKAIIAGRPYRSVHELVSKRVLKRSTFSRIKDRITVNTAEQPTAAPKASVVQALNARSETRRRQ